VAGMFRVGEWRVEPRLNLVRSGDRSVRLEPKVIDVLCCLAARPGEVLGKEEIIQEVWPDTFVTDDVLIRAVGHLRRALGDDAASPRYLETIPKRGYRLVAEVELPEEGGGTIPGRAEAPAAGPAPTAGTAAVEDLFSGRRAVLRLLRPAAAEEEERGAYPGLAPFTEGDAELFFGREGEIEALWERIGGRGLLGVIGPSGTGKTSFLRAGVIPARPRGWAAVYATPGSDPVLGLARALASLLAGDDEAVGELLAAVTELARGGGPERLTGLLKGWRGRRDGILLVFDQFEELFTLNPPETRKRTASLLGALAAEAGATVVLSLRDDFLVRCCELPPLAPILKDLTVLLTPGRDGLRRALTEPAASRGYRFEDEALVEEMVSAVEGSRGALPLLAFAVSRLWEGRDRERRLLTRAAYGEVGGVEGALARHAEATLERIGGGREAVVREIFRNLATSQGTRAAMEREELLSAFTDRATAEEVLRLLVNARLLTTYEVEGREGGAGRHRVEVVHESLLEAWPRLARWRARDEEGAVLRDQLRQAAHLWEEKGRPPDLLWTGTSYRELQLWRERYPGTLTAVEEEFTRAMVHRVRRRRRAKQFVVAAVIAVLSIVAVSLNILRQRALDAAQRAEASKLLAIAQLRLADDPTEALAYATASLELSDTEESRLFALRALAEGPPVRELDSGISMSWFPAFSPDGTRLAVAGSSSEAAVWDQEGSLLVRLGGLEPSPNSNVPFWAGNELLAAGMRVGPVKRVQVWSIPDGREIRKIDLDPPGSQAASTSGLTRFWDASIGRLFSVTLSTGPDHHQIALLRSWKLPDGDEEVLGRVDLTALRSDTFMMMDVKALLYIRENTCFLQPFRLAHGSERIFSRHDSEITAMGAFTEIPRYWLVDQRGRIRIWTCDGLTPVDRVDIPKPETAPTTIEPERSGRWVWKRPSGDQTAQFWALEALPGSRPLTLRRNESWYMSQCDVLPSGDWVVCSTGLQDSRRYTFWPLAQIPPTVIDGYRPIQRPVAISPDSRWIATSWGDFRLRLWPLPGTGNRAVRQLEVPNTLWTALAFDPASRYFFAAGRGSIVRVPLDGGPVQGLEAFSRDEMVFGIDISPSARFFAAAVGYGPVAKRLRIWDLETGGMREFLLPVPESPADAPPTQPTGYEGGVFSLMFDGESTLFSAGHGGIRRWDLDTGTHSLVWEGPWVKMWAVGNAPVVCARTSPVAGASARHRSDLVDLATSVSTPAPRLAAFGDSPSPGALSSVGPVMTGISRDGVVRVGRTDTGTPHVLVGHVGPGQAVAISPDLKWVASTAQDNTLRLWPMPDLSKPPLHTLPHDELIAKLKSLTNLRAVRDPEAEGGWKIELAPFPGWKDVPTW
jgi:DNA-binding winged helix-turn-helix (wHTH) protein/WD40 repeat protein